MAHGGKRPGAGRKAGAVTKASRSRAVADRATNEGLTPLEYLLSVMRDENNELATRADAAKAAARYMHATLAPVEPQRDQRDDYVPLADRLLYYAKVEAIEASKGKVVELPRKLTSPRKSSL